MVTIRSEQLEVLGRAALAAFSLGTAAQLQNRHPRRFGRRSDPKRFVETCIDKAMAHGFHEPHDLRRYIDLCVQLGLDFDQTAPYDQVLAQIAWRGPEGVLAKMEGTASSGSA